MLNRIDDFRSGVAQTEASFKKMKEELEVGRKAHDQTIATAKAELDKARLELKTTPVLSAIQAERTRLAVEEAEARTSSGRRSATRGDRHEGAGRATPKSNCSRRAST